MQWDHYRAIRFSRRGRILTATLNRPEALNAVNAQLHTELSHLFYDLQLDQESDIIIFTGEGRAFSAGGDFENMKANLGRQDLGTDIIEAKKMVYGLLDLEKPIIAKMNGDAMGLGATLALFCDVIFAAETAKIADPHVRVGIVAGDGGAVIWPQLIGYARAKHYLLTGEAITGREAQAMGLVNYAVPASELDAEVERYADRLSAGAQLALRWTKVAVNVGLKQLAHSIMDVGLGYEIVSMKSKDHAEGIAAFAEKRKPRFGG